MDTANRWKRIFSKSIPATMQLYLAFSFFLYGIVKIPGQFSPPKTFTFDPSQDEPLILAWHFFGYSRFYELFIGIAELACALLLLFPRTRTIAAICLFPITLNITIVNFAFDISAQNYSLLLTVMCGLLLWVDRKKLYGLLAK
jgi:uncharacterized membrane protein YphA (DoxX/SURF4 family)